MWDFIVQNIGTIIVSIILIVIFALIIVFRVKAKKKGESSCGCNCLNCPSHGACHQNVKKDEK